MVDTTPSGARERRQATRTLPTLEAARTFVAEVRTEVQNSGGYANAQVETVAQLCERWLASRRNIRPVTVDGYRAVLAPVRRRIGDHDIRALTVRDVENLTAWLVREGGKNGRALGPRSVRASLVALAQAFDMAAREDSITRNPVRLAERPRVRTRVGRDLEHWQPAELLAFRTHADTDRLAGAWRLTLSGLTRADILGLRWSDIDLAAGVVAVSQGRVALSRGDHVDDPKSAHRVRAVPVESIHPGTVVLLRRLKATQAEDKLSAGPAYRDSDFVVVGALGGPLRPEVYSDRFRAMCKTAGITSITLHSVRHSLAFWLHQLGVAPADAAALLGHTVEVHLSTYLPHSGAAGITAAAQALGRATVGG